MKLTDKMRETLESCREFTDGRSGAVGMFPRDIGQESSMRALLRRGLVEFHGWGRDVDHERDSDVPIYKITDAGRAELGSEDSCAVEAR